MIPALDRARVRAILFDVDGTLADTDDAFVTAVARALGRAAFLFEGRDPSRFARRLVMGAESPLSAAYALFDRLHLDELAAPVLDRLQRVRLGRGSQDFVLIPGVREMLQALVSHYPLALVTARGERGTRAFLEEADLDGLFQTAVNARTVLRSKPHPAPVLHAAELLGIPAGACLMVGDTTLDVRAGRGAGAQTVGVLCGFGERAELARAGANLILESTAQLAAVMLDGEPGEGEVRPSGPC